MLKITKSTEFDWDIGNWDKNYYKHNVTRTEAEEVFFNRPILLSTDKKHSTTTERRYLALGKTNRERKLFISFTERENMVRIISVRDMTPNERQRYEEH
ncbi:MAG: BrnT family toxin, partial [Ignavibacteria bacterium]|nr:BrnT family toxin [Ignavibacteria bacterium]MCU7514063.1 BrnT family toxin [Ignavibacteria bacterium]